MFVMKCVEKYENVKLSSFVEFCQRGCVGISLCSPFMIENGERIVSNLTLVIILKINNSFRVSLLFLVNVWLFVK